MTLDTTSAGRAERERPDDLSALRHEIRTPLAGMVGLLDLLSEGSLDQDQAAIVRTLRGAADQLSALVDANFSPMFGDSVLTTERRNFSLVNLVTEVARLNAVNAGRKSLNLLVDVDPRLPADVIGDPLRLQQVLNNLVSNGVKFTESGSVTVRVSQSANRKVRFDVIDSGSGIDREALRTLTQRPNGSGIGLRITRSILEGLGARLNLTDGESGGTIASFLLDLPVARPKGDTELFGPAEILLVEDDPVSQQIVELLLEGMGHRVTVATTGTDAMRLCTERRFDLVLADGHLPDMSGVDLVRQIRGIGLLTMHVVALTATATTADRDRSLAAGMDGYLSKPVTRHHLAEAVAGSRRPYLTLA
jgi:CheY-like chemotaxis protein